MLQSNNLIGFGLVRKKPVLTNVAAFTGSAMGTGTTYTITGANIGVAAADRIVVVAGCLFSFPPTTPITLTIAGITATVLNNTANGSGANGEPFIGYALVPTGTTGNLVFTYGGAGTTHLLAGDIYNINQWNTFVPTPTNTAGGVNPLTLSIGAVPINGIVIAGYGSFASVTMTTTTMTNITRNNAAAVDPSRIYGSAYSSLLGGTTANSVITMTGSGALSADAISAVWA